MTFELLKGLALGSITVEELSQELIVKLGEVSKAEATTIAQGVKSELEQAMAQGNKELEDKITKIEESIASGEIFTKFQTIEGRLDSAEGEIDTLQSELAAHKSETGTAIQELKDKDGLIDAEIEKLKATVSGKNNATQVFANMEEFEAYATSNKKNLKKGDLAYVIDIKKSYIYNLDAVPVLLDGITPPEGWIFFDEINTELDLADYAKTVDVEAGLAKKAEKEHVHAMDDVTGLNDALAGKAAVKHNHEMSEVNGLEEALALKLEKADLADLEGKVATNEGGIADNKAAIEVLNGGADQVGSVDYKIAEVKKVLDGVDTKLREDMTKAQADIVANAEEIAKLTAKNYILTRKQELVDVVEAQTEYELTAVKSSDNFIADVFVNSVRLVEGEGKDYTLTGTTLKLNKARSAGSVIQVLFTYISDANAPQA